MRGYKNKGRISLGAISLPPRGKSYDFIIYKYSTSVVPSRLERFSNVKKIVLFS
jgi:hypothetical protein